MIKKLFFNLSAAIILLGWTVQPAFGYAINCSEQCEVGYYKSSLTGGLCECIEKSTRDKAEDLEVTDQALDQFDPLKISGSEQQEALSKPGGIISRVLDFAFPLAGIILFIMITMGGFQILMGAGEQKSMEAGRQKVTSAIVGFILLFASYWIAQILQELLNIKIL